MYFRLDSNGDVKVGDFGLAEDVYSTGYFRQSDSERVKLPYKWLALESLNDAIFNEKTDVVRTINALNSFLMIIIEIKNATLYHALDCGLWTIKTELFAWHTVSPIIVVVWCDRVGGLQWRPDPLPCIGPNVSSGSTQRGQEIGASSECCLFYRNVFRVLMNFTINTQFILSYG